MTETPIPPRGPLSDVRIVELGGIGPTPFAGMVLAGLGAEVIRIERPGAQVSAANTILLRGRQSVAVDLKQPEGADAVLRLIDSADALFEGFRPGVSERLGLGPDVCLARNPRLVYGRMTGWGQDGPLAQAPGHDINYIGLTGVLHAIGPASGDPVPPLNLVGDFGGGMLLALGVVSALLHARATGKGQVVDAAMTDGSALLLAMTHGFLAAGQWPEERGASLFSGSAPFYTTYRCADGEHVAVGAIEPQFYAALVRGLGLADDPVCAVQQRAPGSWPAVRQRFAEVFATRSRDAWAEHFAGTQACVTPVLSLTEAPAHPHNAARGTFLQEDGPLRPAPAPRFSATPATATRVSPKAGEDTRSVLAGAGLTEDELDRLIARGVIA
ncbi:CaiB/BaiF CoA transferase family protein [Streptomyces sp. NPDC050145]|uniref:CaiB/BaiF CoA transferase family protein n=1 Tax=Streptomyces sp. NPDC050145 TaxID=3365602 RepID=UPI0037887CD0